ncbi:LysM peptidoglycan-binding domain-containing protein [Arthrobacter sp. MDT1-65]
MAEAPAQHGSTALWALTPTRPEPHLRLVRSAPPATAPLTRSVPLLRSVPALQSVPPVRTAWTGPRVPRPRGSASRTATSTLSDTSMQPRTSMQRSTERPVTLTRRGRLVLVGLPIALGVAALILLGAFLTSQAQASESLPAPSSTVEVSVAAGESLWDLALRYAPDRDPREVVAEMVELNDLRSSVVQAGQSIAVPAAG